MSNAAAKAATLGAVGSIGSAAITTAGNIATSKAALGVAAAAGYKAVLDKAGEIGDQVGSKIGDAYSDWKYGDENRALDAKLDFLKQQKKKIASDFIEYSKISNLGQAGSSDVALRNDQRAIYLTNQLKSGVDVIPDGGGRKTISRDDAQAWLANNGYEVNKDGVVNRASNWVDPKAAVSGAAGAAGAAGASGAGGWTLFGMSAATVGWIVAGVAAAAVITPYIYDKVRACTKTWMADIIAEVKFKADGKNYRCFYDLKNNKWVLTYADIKWTSYLDNKLDKETIDEFFASNFFNQFLDKCRKAFAMLFSTGRNEVVFKALPEIKDAPKELKKILEKIYDNKGAISKNMFAGKHD